MTCDTCEDTHRAWSERHGQYFPCTHCPVPCGSCANCGGCGMYCQATPCACACHVNLALVTAYARCQTVPPEPAAAAMVLGCASSGIWREGERDFGDEDADQPEPCAMVELTISSGIHSLSVNGIVSF